MKRFACCDLRASTHLEGPDCEGYPASVAKAMSKRPSSGGGTSAAKRPASALARDERVDRPTDLAVGSQVEALDVQELWFPACIKTVRQREVLVSFDGWDSQWDEWLPRDSPRLRRHRGWGTAAKPDDYQIDSTIEALDMEGKWYASRVLHVAETAVMVKYARWADKWNEWIDKDSGRLRPLGQDGVKLDGDRRETHEDLCGTCEDAGELVCCEGRCKRAFHVACIPAHNAPPADGSDVRWSCTDCKTRRFRCFLCKRWGTERVDVHRCGRKGCGKSYHPECLVASLMEFGDEVVLPPMPMRAAVSAASETAAETASETAPCRPCSSAAMPTSPAARVGAGRGKLLEDGTPPYGGKAAVCVECTSESGEGTGAAWEEAENQKDVGETDDDWLRTDHRWLGRRVRRFFDEEPVDGTITCWLPATASDLALWHMEHDDGDAEDLDDREVRTALRAFLEDWAFPKRGLFAEPDLGDADEGAGARRTAACQSTPKAKRAGATEVHGSPGGTPGGGNGDGDEASRAPVPIHWAGLTCARHSCTVCKKAESSGYGQAMMNCLRCPTSVHWACASVHSHLQLTSRTFLCERCTTIMPRGLNAPDPNMPTGALAGAKRGMLLLPLPSDDLCDALSLKDFASVKLGLQGVKDDFGPPEDLLVSLRAREVVPTADFAPPPYETLRRSIYLHDQPREKLSADDVTVCSCTLASGGCDHRCANRAMQSECSNASCRLGPSCGNRPFANLGATSQRPLQLFKTDGKGWGVMSTRNIEQGELVVEYVGEVIDHDTWEYRKAKLWRFDHMYFMTLNRTEIVDATERGNIARFINHSCDPSLQVEKWYVNRTPRLGLWAKRPIMAGEELSYNYSVKWHGDPDVAQRCYCGAYNCTGYLGLPPKR